MAAYTFPTDLLTGIKSRWQTTADQQFKLPEDGILLKLLETCYHASLRTTEQRTVEFVVAFAPIEDIPQNALRLADGPVVLTDSELVRLSPMTQRRQTVIGCDREGDWLRIWGFFEYGHAWVQHSAGDPPEIPVQSVDFPPDCLTITIEGPGKMTVSQGRTSLVRLRDGRMIFPQENLLQSTENSLGRFFHELVADLQASDRYRQQSPAIEKRDEQRTLQNVYTTSVLAILERIRIRQHGGSVMIATVPLNDQHAHVTYSVSDHAGLFGEIVDYKALDDVLRVPHSTSDVDGELEHCRTELALGRTSRQLTRGISRISLLAAVDGAVLLDHHLRILGFGVRFPVLLPPGTKVLDALSGNEYLCDQWGLRHQSVFSVCHKCEQSVGLIVSQDGEAKAVKSVNGRLMFWDGILD